MGLTQVSTDGVKNDAITKTKIPANQIEASELADNAVDTNAIADQAVALSKLPHGDSNNNGKFLRANNGADPTFETVSSVGGLTGVDFNDNVKARFGTGNDLEIYSSGTIGHIKAANDDLRLETSRLSVLNRAGNETLIDAYQDGAVELNYDNSKKFETTSSGTTVTGAQTITGGGSDNLKIDMTGAVNPYINFREGTTNKAFMQWDAGTDDLRIYNYDSPTDLRIGNGGLMFGGDTAAANALDDYEEGNWTPTIQFGGNSASVTYQNQSGSYTKVGNRVYFQAYLHLSNKGSSTGVVGVGGLPYTTSSFTYSVIPVWINTWAGGNTVPTGYVEPNATTIRLQRQNASSSGGVFNMDQTNIYNTTDIMVSGHYEAA